MVGKGLVSGKEYPVFDFVTIYVTSVRKTYEIFTAKNRVEDISFLRKILNTNR